MSAHCKKLKRFQRQFRKIENNISSSKFRLVQITWRQRIRRILAYVASDEQFQKGQYQELNTLRSQRYPFFSIFKQENHFKTFIFNLYITDLTIPRIL